MTPDELQYSELVKRLERYKATNRTESATFLRWFLENILRLDDVEAVDSVCDGPGDLGVDGIYVDHDVQEIEILQAKIRQNENKAVGDAAIREFAGALKQFSDAKSVAKTKETTGSSDLRKLLNRQKIEELLADGYTIRGVFITNSIFEKTARTSAETFSIELYDRYRIADEYIEIDAPSGVNAWANFDVSDIEPLEFKAGKDANVFILPAKASDLLKLEGLSDGVLFSQNVRLSLGNTKVNKDIAKTLGQPDEHVFFPLYHNGITIVCDGLEQDNDLLSVHGYVVVNGAQSLSVLYHNRRRVTDDLRIIAKIVEIKDDVDLATKITLFSNNQNSIKPRDMRSNHQLQVRIKSEFEKIDYEEFRYEVKRGEQGSGAIISNEEAGRLLLAYDLGEPWSCHQIYKVFDEKHADIFGRPLVTAWRIILLKKIMDGVVEELPKLDDDAFARYTLTRFFVLFALKRVLGHDEWASRHIEAPKDLLRDTDLRDKFLAAVQQLVVRLVIDLKFEVQKERDANPDFDYKSALKSPGQVEKLGTALEQSFERDVARGREGTVKQIVDGEK